ncbi:MAG TPA: phosphosulfolactate synthase, partial [Cryomorphaceae bacterium]|nr:phosphosulfolactate synthase [Cryomorphaceae bacterium]
MNFDLPFIPERTERPRSNGLTMVMDKGMSLREAENFIDANSSLTDIIKLGFGTSYLTKDLKE